MNLFYLVLTIYPVVCFCSTDLISAEHQNANSTINNIVPRIAGGSNAYITRHPYQGYLLKVVNRTGYFICGCTLIAPEWAVTAAQCLERTTSSFSYYVVFGTNDVIGYGSSINDPYHQIRRVRTYHKPSRYVSATTGYDISLLRLSSAVDIRNSTVSPISLPCAGDSLTKIDESSCFITGWGDTDTSGKKSRYLQSASVTIVNNAVCDGQYRQKILSSHICTGSRFRDVSTCSGDGGGPLACRSTLDRSWVFVGISSLRPKTCGGIGALSSIFTRTSSYVTWIVDVIATSSPSSVSTLTFQESKSGSTGVIYCRESSSLSTISTLTLQKYKGGSTGFIYGGETSSLSTVSTLTFQKDKGGSAGVIYGRESSSLSIVSTLTFQEGKSGNAGVIYGGGNRLVIWLSAILCVLIGRFKF